MPDAPRRVCRQSGPEILFGPAFGMTEPPNGEPSAAGTRGTLAVARGDPEPKKHTLFSKLKWDLTAGDRMPVFAPASELAGNPRGLAGTQAVFLSDARQTLRSAASIISRASKGDTVTLFAFSFDHPTVTGAILDAVFRGAEISIYMDHGYVCGDSWSMYCKRTLIDVLKKAARASWPGRLCVYSQTGGDVKAAYARHDRSLSREVGLGHCHAKALYKYPYLLVGSTNWSVASESNLELSVLLEIQDRETKEYVEAQLKPMTVGAVLQSAASIEASMRRL